MVLIQQPLRLYRQFFKVTQNCADKHLKMYARRRVRQEYEKSRTLAQQEVPKFLEERAQELEVLKRQTIIRNLYSQSLWETSALRMFGALLFIIIIITI